jgi:hypothetical protein
MDTPTPNIFIKKFKPRIRCISNYCTCLENRIESIKTSRKQWNRFFPIAHFFTRWWELNTIHQEFQNHHQVPLP